MKKLLIIVVLSLWANLVFADSYKILYVNDANLTYKDGRKVQKGDVISDASSIKWEKAKQAVKVINQSTKRQALFTGRNYVRPEGADALVYIRHASTQASGNSIHAKLYNTFRGQYELLDSIEVPTDLELSEDCYFTAAYMYGDTKIVNRLNYKDGDVIIDGPALFAVCIAVSAVVIAYILERLAVGSCGGGGTVCLHIAEVRPV